MEPALSLLTGLSPPLSPYITGTFRNSLGFHYSYLYSINTASSNTMAEEGSYCYTHCINCFKSQCRDTICPLAVCECRARMHECKLKEHQEQICPETEVSCLMERIGCPLQMKRRDLQAHVSVCPANTLMCHMQRVRRHERRSPQARDLHPRESDPVQLRCYLHDLSLIRRLGFPTSRSEEQLKNNPHREELESLIRSVSGCTCGNQQMGSSLYDLFVGDSEAVVRCHHLIRRDEAEHHRVSHLCLAQYLKTVSCPMQSYGCPYKPLGVQFLGEMGACRFDFDSCGLVVNNVEISYEVDYDRISCLPYRAMCLILDRLDSLSMWCLSIVSKQMRELCYERLYTKGLVRIEWERDGRGGWCMGRKSWSFSRVTKLPPYRLSDKSFSEVSRHLDKCAYYRKERVDYKSLPDRVLVPGLAAED